MVERLMPPRVCASDGHELYLSYSKSPETQHLLLRALRVMEIIISLLMYYIKYKYSPA